jgi:SEFIR domain family
MTLQQPKVFISYSWDSESHKEWVKRLTDSLIENGVDAHLDQYDLELGDRLPKYMENQITNSDFVLIICTENYKKKADNRKSGVGYEGHIISGELLLSADEKKFIPILRSDDIFNIMPIFLAGKLGVRLKDDFSVDDNAFQDLLATLFNVKIKSKPKLGEMPERFNGRTSSKDGMNIQDIKIEGIITNEVTVPRMDGTAGSALYKIPFRLNRKPSEIWNQLFLRAWSSPPEFTTMHRPGIAEVIGDKIILDGTTIEEVQDYHRKTLILCVDKANSEEREILARNKLIKEREEARKQEHYDKIRSLSNQIPFD